MKVKARFDIPADNPHNYSDEFIAKGDVLTVFQGNTYGVVREQAFTFSDDPFEGPFFELPREYVAVDGEDAF